MTNCSSCSVVNYDESMERTFCLACNDEYEEEVEAGSGESSTDGEGDSAMQF